VSPLSVLGALLAGTSVTCLALALLRPPRRLGPRVDDYTLVARSKLGTGPGVLSLARPAPPAMGGALLRVFAPMLTSLARSASVLAGTRDDAALRLQLRQAGIRGMEPDRYRNQQLLLALAATAVFGVGGGLLGAAAGQPPALLAIVTGGCGFVLGTVWRTAQLGRRIKSRQERMRAELFTLSQVIAIYARANPNVMQITEQVVSRTRGELGREMAGVLRAIETGEQPEIAFQNAAALTPEPTAARLYRVLATAASAGGDIADGLLALAVDIRDAQREEAKQSAVKRQATILAPLIILLAPIILILVAAPVPRFILRLQ
jgi:tight adherence protein C